MLFSGDRANGPTFALADIGWIDFESRSPSVSIADGTYRYACGADAIVLAWGLGDGAVNATAVADFKRPLQWSDMPAEFHFHHRKVIRGEAIWAAWNAGFDKAIWNYATIGFPVLEPRMIFDVMAQAVASGLPPDLKQAAIACG